MDKLTLFLVRILILQCFLHWCSPDKKVRTLESFNRGTTENRFLKAEWDKGKEAFKLSFNGSKGDANTTFIFKRSKLKGFHRIAIHLAEDYNYFLAADNNGSGLVVKKLPDASWDPTRLNSSSFALNRVSIPFTEEGRPIMHIIVSSVGGVIRSNKSGFVSLDKENGCGSWIRINDTDVPV